MAGALARAPDLPGARVLLSEESEAVFASAVKPFEVKALHPRQVIAKLGSSLTVTFDCDLVGPDGIAAERMLIARAGSEPPPGTTVVSDGDEQIGVWIYPHDPWLPGLPALFDPVKRAQLLSPARLDSATAIARSYRPASRGVVELIAGEDTCFAKAVRPRVVHRLEARHRLFSAVMSVPRSLADSAEAGLLVLESQPGETLLECISREPTDAPSGEEIVELLNRMPAFDSAVVSPVEREHGALLALLLPDLASLVRKIVDEVRGIDPQPLVPAHGDLHAGQIIISSTGELGLIDIDGAGMGARADDLAGLLAQLSALGGSHRTVDDLREEFERSVEPQQLRLRTAAALLGFAAVPFTNQERDWPEQVARRLELAAAWIDGCPDRPGVR